LGRWFGWVGVTEGNDLILMGLGLAEGGWGNF
jgi:hypothetical protein